MHKLKLKKCSKKDSDTEADNRGSENNESKWKRLQFFSKWAKKGKTKTRTCQDSREEKKGIEDANTTGSALKMNVPGV